MNTAQQTAMQDAKALISGLEYPYLIELQALLAAEITIRQKSARQDAIIRIQKIAQEVGLKPEELFGLAKKSEKGSRTIGPAVIKFRHPHDASLHWSGRGRAPLWVSDWERAHGSLDAVRVPELEAA